MLHTVNKFEKIKPENKWSGKLTYCKACGDIICSVADLPDTCDCGNSTVTKLRGSGAVGTCMVSVKKGDTLKGSVGHEQIEECTIQDFAAKFKKLFISEKFPRNVTITVVPKDDTPIETPSVAEQVVNMPKIEQEIIVEAEPIFVENYTDEFGEVDKSKAKLNKKSNNSKPKII